GRPSRRSTSGRTGGCAGDGRRPPGGRADPHTRATLQRRPWAPPLQDENVNLHLHYPAVKGDSAGGTGGECWYKERVRRKKQDLEPQQERSRESLRKLLKAAT